MDTDEGIKGKTITLVIQNNKVEYRFGKKYGKNIFSNLFKKLNWIAQMPDQ